MNRYHFVIVMWYQRVARCYNSLAHFFIGWMATMSSFGLMVAANFPAGILCYAVMFPPVYNFCPSQSCVFRKNHSMSYWLSMYHAFDR
jgi:hypothetical protein